MNWKLIWIWIWILDLLTTHQPPSFPTTAQALWIGGNSPLGYGCNICKSKGRYVPNVVVFFRVFLLCFGTMLEAYPLDQGLEC